MLAAFGVGGRRGEWIALATMPIGLVVAIATASGVLRSGASLQYVLGAWVPPLGIALRADGIAAAMLVATAVVVCAVAVFARADFRSDAAGEARAPFVFWTLLLSVWGALNAVFVAGDLFTLYVALELLTFAAVPLVCLDGRAEQFAAALRYLLFALVGSMFYLLGAVLLYGTYGVLDIALLAARVQSGPATWTAAALMTTGLLAKTALFPLHLWLPPAHAGAPAAASAVLSALVVKGSFFLLVRVWLDVMPGVLAGTSAQLLAGLGATAIAFGSVVALRQARLKLLIAYSTVAQIGYLFLMFPLVLDGTAGAEVSQIALDGGILQAVSHALAKAAMFMAAGLIYAGLGHDRIAELAGSARAMPLTVWSFALAGVSLIGLPPSGGFFAKWLLLRAAVATGHWGWVAVLLVGGLLTSAYVMLVLVRALARPAAPLVLRAPIPRHRELAALTLALCSVLLGLLAFAPVDLLSIGRTPIALVQAP
jgi:formate hydrogenlyase subunit 3/multisubunit Na+/H+ antiporter MnhD subunit